MLQAYRQPRSQYQLLLLAAQLELVDKKKQDLEKLHQREIEHLETLSGLSAEEAKERLIESLKDEAKSEATSYINEIMEEAKMTANKEAKKIVIQSIQRVATETAIENSITVFHIESDCIFELRADTCFSRSAFK